MQVNFYHYKKEYGAQRNHTSVPKLGFSSNFCWQLWLQWHHCYQHIRLLLQQPCCFELFLMKLGAWSTSSYPNMCRRESGPKLEGFLEIATLLLTWLLSWMNATITSLINSTRLLKSTCAQKLVPQLRSSRFFKLRMTRTRQSPSRMAKSLLRSSRESNSSGKAFV